MPEELMVTIGIIAICAAAVGVAMQIGGVFRARAMAAHEFEYRQLVVEANDAQRRMAEALDRAVAEISTLRTRAESMERLLQEVG